MLCHSNYSIRGVFRTHSNIYDGAFWQKKVNGFQTLINFGENAIVDVGPGSKYISDIPGN